MLAAPAPALYRPDAPPAIRSVPPLGAVDRKASCWPEAFVKQSKLIQQELFNDPDDDSWQAEAMVVEDAADQYERLIGPLDRQLNEMKIVRREVMNGLAAGLEKRYPKNPNLAQFLRRDDPTAYLSW